jgi:hypothetical protein
MGYRALWLFLVWVLVGKTFAGEIPIYDAPSPDSTVMTTLVDDGLFEVIGRSDTALWLEIRVDAQTGWVYANHLTTPIPDLADLPITAQQIAIIDLDDYPQDQRTEHIDSLLALADTPILYNFDSPQIQAIFEQGQALGNHAGIFIKIGDSNSTSGDYLRPMGMRFWGCNYGIYETDFSETIQFFSSEKPYPAFINSFDTTNVTAQNGLNTFGLFDSFWATADYCRGGESPLACEYRIMKPSIALVMIGLMDLEQIPVEVYARNLDRAVAWLIEQGVIPVLSTFPVLNDYPEAGARSLWGKSIELNLAMVTIAEKYQIPLVNLWGAFQSLPDVGIGPDRTHIRHELGKFCDFTGAEAEISGTLRNYLTLRALDTLYGNLTQNR